MNREERLRKNRYDYWSGFGVGFLRGSGLFSAVVLALFNWYKRSNKTKEEPLKQEKGPERFDIIE